MSERIDTIKEYSRRAEIELGNNPEIGFIAVDHDGEVFWYGSEPTIGGKRWVFNDRVPCTRLGRLPIQLSKEMAGVIWKHSLVFRVEPVEELYPIDTLVSVKRNTNGRAFLRYSCGTSDSNGQFLCWAAGRTSKTASENDYTPWKHVELVCN